MTGPAIVSCSFSCGTRLALPGHDLLRDPCGPDTPASHPYRCSRNGDDRDALGVWADAKRAPKQHSHTTSARTAITLSCRPDDWWRHWEQARRQFALVDQGGISLRRSGQQSRYLQHGVHHSRRRRGCRYRCRRADRRQQQPGAFVPVRFELPR